MCQSASLSGQFLDVTLFYIAVRISGEPIGRGCGWDDISASLLELCFGFDGWIPPQARTAELRGQRKSSCTKVAARWRSSTSMTWRNLNRHPPTPTSTLTPPGATLPGSHPNCVSWPRAAKE